MVAYRHPSFLGGVVQMTVTPLAILPLLWTGAEVGAVTPGAVAPDVGAAVRLMWAPTVEAAALSFLIRHAAGWWRPAAGPPAAGRGRAGAGPAPPGPPGGAAGWWRPAAGPAAEVRDAAEAGLATLGLLAWPLACCVPSVPMY